MSERSGTEKRQLARVITIRVSGDMDEAIVRLAGSQTRGHWIRGVLAERTSLSTSPSKRRSPGAVATVLASRQDVEVLRAAATSTARAVGMLKLVAAQMRVAGEPDLHKRAEIVLSEMRDAAQEIQRCLADAGGKK
ncbi:MAG: hypothetical protein HC788_04940 [Sphingopyxis sp.]|nr:hypothetical protein [Sphingopyxis sp.]